MTSRRAAWRSAARGRGATRERSVARKRSIALYSAPKLSEPARPSRGRERQVAGLQGKARLQGAQRRQERGQRHGQGPTRTTRVRAGMKGWVWAQEIRVSLCHKTDTSWGGGRAAIKGHGHGRASASARPGPELQSRLPSGKLHRLVRMRTVGGRGRFLVQRRKSKPKHHPIDAPSQARWSIIIQCPPADLRGQIAVMPPPVPSAPSHRLPRATCCSVNTLLSDHLLPPRGLSDPRLP